MGDSIGISLEAFKYSNQAALMHKSGILTSSSLSSLDKSKSLFDKNKVSNSDEKEDNQVTLASPVLLKNEEVTKVDSLLLCVPLPIKTLTASERVKRGNGVISNLKYKNNLQYYYFINNLLILGQDSN